MPPISVSVQSQDSGGDVAFVNAHLIAAQTNHWIVLMELAQQWCWSCFLPVRKEFSKLNVWSRSAPVPHPSQTHLRRSSKHTSCTPALPNHDTWLDGVTLGLFIICPLYLNILELTFLKPDSIKMCPLFHICKYFATHRMSSLSPGVHPVYLKTKPGRRPHLSECSPSFVYKIACLQRRWMLHLSICMRITATQIKISLMFAAAKSHPPYLCCCLHLKT